MLLTNSFLERFTGSTTFSPNLWNILDDAIRFLSRPFTYKIKILWWRKPTIMAVIICFLLTAGLFSSNVPGLHSGGGWFESRLDCRPSWLRFSWYLFTFCMRILDYLSTMQWRRIGGSGCIAPRILDFGTRWRWVVSFMLRPLYPQGKSLLYPLDRKLGGPQSRSGRGG
jgi:hypothetical protein